MVGSVVSRKFSLAPGRSAFAGLVRAGLGKRNSINEIEEKVIRGKSSQTLCPRDTWLCECEAISLGAVQKDEMG